MNSVVKMFYAIRSGNRTYSAAPEVHG